MKKALFILSGNISTTPRALKAILLAKEHYQFDLVIVNRGGSWLEKDKEIEKKHNLNVAYLNLGRKPFFNWLMATFVQILSKYAWFLINPNIYTAANASNKSSIVLWQYLKSKNYSGYSVIFGYSSGSLYPAFKLSQKWRIPFIFDVEDYHPGEFIRHDAQNEKARREFLMKTLLPKATAITSASPLIGEYTLNLIGGHPNHTVILNSFPKSEFTLPTHIPLCGTPLRFDSQLKLVWFSQKISFGRGLEQLFEALATLTHEQNLQEPSLRHQPQTSNFELPTSNIEPIPFHGTPLRCETSNQNPIPYILSPKTYPLNPIPYPLKPIPYILNPKTYNLNLTLIGDLDPKFNQQIIEPFLAQLETLKQVVLHPSFSLRSSVSLKIMSPMTQSALHAELANHDVGLALEFSDTDLNRQLCLTNKILAYAQAGLYILATNTPAQSAFMAQQPHRGVVCGQTPEAMATTLSQIIENSHQIKQQAPERFEKGKDLAWEKEREKLQAIWEG